MHTYKTVEAFLADQPTEKLEQIQALRAIILEAPFTLTEHIKWNSPSYVFASEDRITFNVTGKDQRVKLVFHMGATRKEHKADPPIIADDAGLLTWASDIRGYAIFDDLADIERKSNDLQSFIAKWLSL